MLFAAAAGVVVAGCASANEAGGSGSINLGSMLITADPVAEVASAAMHSVDVISRHDIARSPATNLADLLARVNGVTIRRRGAPGVQADMAIRGSGFEQTLVLVDGIPIRSPQTGHHNLNVPVPLAHVDHVEIIKGPGALQYGGSATGGVINIVTRHPREFEAGAALMAGSHATGRLRAHIGGGGADLSTLLSASVAHTDGEDARRPTDADVRRALFTGQARLPSVRVSWGVGASNKEYGAWGFYSGAFPDERERIKSRLAWGGARFALGHWHGRSRLYWRGYRDRFGTRIGGTNFVNRHDTDVIGFKGSLDRAGGNGITAVGVSWRHARIDSNALSNHRRRKVSLWLFRRQRLSATWRIELGLNQVHYSDYGSYWLPSFALSWQFATRWHAFASAARSTRVPSYTELYLNTPANHGNPALTPERSDSYELGLAGHWASQRIKASLFERRNNSLIDWTRQPGEVTWRATNFAGYRARGLDLSWRWQPDLRWLDKLTVGYEALDIGVDRDANPIKYALRVPDHTFRVHVRVPLANQFALAVDARRPDYAEQGAATLAAAKLTWIDGQVRVSIEARNLLNERIVETGFAPIAGRWFYATVGVDF